MHRGYVKLWRKFKDSDLWKEKRVFSKWEAWEDIFTSANHKDQTVIIGNMAIECKRGQCLKSLDTWRERWGWGSKKKVRDFFTLLKSIGNITTENVSKTTRLTVCNYDTYQDLGNDKETIRARLGNDEETQRAPKNNDKKDKNEKRMNNNSLWRNDFSEYLILVNKAFEEIINDSSEMEKQQSFYPNVDIKKSLEKSIHNFWGTEVGWKNKKGKRIKSINMRMTLINNIDKNKVWKKREDTYEPDFPHYKVLD